MPEQGTEMDTLHKMFGPDDHATANGTQGEGDKQVSLIDALKDTDVEKGNESKVVESTEADKVGDNAEVKKKKEPSVFSKVGKFVKEQLYCRPVVFWGLSKNSVIITLTLTCICLVAAVISLSVVTVNGSKRAAQSSGGVNARGILKVNAAPIKVVATGYRELRDGRVSLTTTANNLPVVTLSPPADTYDETSTVSAAMQSLVFSSKVQPNMTHFNLNVTDTTAALMGANSIMSVSVDVMTKQRPTVTAFMAASDNVPQVTASISSSPAPSSTHTGTCGEWGDGAGPCARPYGHPNNTPDSWLSALALKSLGEVPTTTVLGAGVKTSSFPMGIPAKASSAASSDLIGASILDESGCGPEAATIYVTVTADEPSSVTDLGEHSTFYATSTSLGVSTMTISGADGPLTTTETAFLDNATGAVSAPNSTLTVRTTTVGPNGTGFSMSSPVATGGILSTSGGEKLGAPKPLGMGGSSSGNGVYCVVMLVALAFLLN